MRKDATIQYCLCLSICPSHNVPQSTQSRKLHHTTHVIYRSRSKVIHTYHNSVLRMGQQWYQHWNDPTLYNYLMPVKVRRGARLMALCNKCPLHLDLFLLSISKEGESPAGIHLHSHVIILHQIHQGWQCLW